MLRRRRWHPTPELLPGKSHGWRSLVGCSPRGHKESDTTERPHFHPALEKEMATHSSALAWRTPGTGNLVGCLLWGRTEWDTTEATQQQQHQCFQFSHHKGRAVVNTGKWVKQEGAVGKQGALLQGQGALPQGQGGPDRKLLLQRQVNPEVPSTWGWGGGQDMLTVSTPWRLGSGCDRGCFTLRNACSHMTPTYLNLGLKRSSMLIKI